jgi:hypothetical protein
MELPLNLFRKLLIFANVLLLVSVGSATEALASSSTSKDASPVASLSQLDQILAKSIKRSNLPTDLVPSLLKISHNQDVQGSAYLHDSCDPYVNNSEALNPVPCWYGSETAKRTVVIFGDSFVGNWIPALNIAGKKLDFRVAEFEFQGCPTNFIRPSRPIAGFDQNEINACVIFHKNLPKAVDKIRPLAVIAASSEGSWGAGTAGTRYFVTTLRDTFDELSSTTNHPVRILLGTGPLLSQPAPSCLESHPNNINLCNFSYTAESVFGIGLARDNAAILGASVHLIATYKWICLNGVCPAVIGNIDVYADADHLTISISKFLSVVLEKAITPLLNTPIS